LGARFNSVDEEDEMGTQFDFDRLRQLLVLEITNVSI
jgi:hypothetical protein